MPSIDDIFERTIRLDERVSKIGENVDRLIAAASGGGKAPPPSDTPPKSDKGPLPNNLSQLAGFVIEKLGKLAIPVLFIAILVGAYLGAQEIISKINQRDAEVRKQFTDTAVATLAVGEKVIKNTGTLIELNGELGKRGKELLDLQKQAADEARKTGIAKLLAGIAEKEAEGAKKAADVAKVSANELREVLKKKENLLIAKQTTVDTKDKQLSDLRSKLTNKEQKLQKAVDLLKTEKAALLEERADFKLTLDGVREREDLLTNLGTQLSEAQQAEAFSKGELKRFKKKSKEERERSRNELAELRAKLETLRTEQSATEFETVQLESQRKELIGRLESARKTIQELGDATATVPELPKPKPILKPVIVEKVQHIETVATTLRQYAEDPNSIDRNVWRRLDDENVTLGELDALMKKDLGFELVLKFVTEKTNSSENETDSETLYLPVRKMTADQIMGIPILEMKANGTRFDVESTTASSFTFIRLRDLSDFHRTQVAAVVDFFKFQGKNQIATLLQFPSTSNTITFSSVIEMLALEEGNRKVVSSGVHFGGTEKAVRILNLSDANAKYPALMKRWLKDERRAFVANGMEARSLTFDANKAVPVDMFSKEADLRTTLVDLLEAAVTGDKYAAAPLLTKPLTPDDLGRLAATALRGNLIFDKKLNVQVARLKSAPETTSASSSVAAASATVFATIDQPKLRLRKEDIEFRFRRESGNPQWKLIGFGTAAKSQKKN